MTNLTIGRVGVDVELNPLRVAESGDELRISGITPYGSADVARAIRQQLRGYLGSSDESFVPVTCAEFPEWNGYYRLDDVSLDATPEGAFAGVWEFSARLIRLRQSASVLQELNHLGKSRVPAWNLVPNSGGESGTTGVAAVNAGGTAAITNPAASAFEGTRVLRSTWSVASTAAGGGMYQDVPVLPSFRYSFGVNRVRSSINNRLKFEVTFYDVGNNPLATHTAAEVQVTAGTVYGAADFKLESYESPATASYARMRVISTAGTGYQNWSATSYLETDGWVANYGMTLLAATALLWTNCYAQYPVASIAVPGHSLSLVLENTDTGEIDYPTISKGSTTRGVGSVWNAFTASYRVGPEWHYEGAATLRALSGGELRPVVGRQVPNTPGDWTIGNELFEIRPIFDTELAFETRQFIAGAWTAWSKVKFRASTDLFVYAFPVPGVWSIMRNSPEAVSVRLMAVYTGGILTPGVSSIESPVHVTITARRGDVHADIQFTSAQPLRVHAQMDSFTNPVAGPYHYRTPDNRFLASTSPMNVKATHEDINSPLGRSCSWGVGYASDYRIINAAQTGVMSYAWGGSEVQSAVLL